ncbi:MAG: ABC transporter ATP-binding protein/permease, partial [Acidimicrobiia bacterium]|nr:ABC transporter ATP-binding protein/permease [Acidimicrobiia bacterium]
VAVGRALGVVVRRYFAGMLTARTKAGLQRRVVDRLIHAPLRYLRDTPTGRLLAHVDSDAEAATELLNPLPFSIGALAILVFAAISLIVVDPWLALVGAFMLPALLVAQKFHSRLIETPAIRMRHDNGVVAAIAHESFDGALVVKTLGREAAEVRRFEEATARLRDARIQVSIIRAAYEQAILILPDLGVVALILVGAGRIDSGAITTGQLVQAVALFSILAFPISVTGYFFSTLPPGTVARDRLDEVFAVADDPLLAPSAHEPLPAGSLAVSLRNVHVELGDTTVLGRMSLHVAAGETVALVGATGAGKSTLLRAMSRLLPLDGGSIRVTGVDLDDIADDELRDRVALALQEPFLFGATIEENLRLGDRSLDDATVRQAVDVAAAQFIDDLPNGLQTVIGERGVTLSGGQRQRVALARAIARRPGLLLLDDATSAVDPTVEQQILANLGRVDTTVIVVAHRLSTIALADRVVFVSGGRIVAEGSHQQLLSRPDYEALVRAYESEENVA